MVLAGTATLTFTAMSMRPSPLPEAASRTFVVVGAMGTARFVLAMPFVIGWQVEVAA
jgi:hypothetical protein